MTNLNKLELKDLILRYESELKKLQMQLDITKKTIDDLKKQEKNAQPIVNAKKATSAAAPAEPKRRGRPKKVTTEATAPAEPKRRGRPKKVTTEDSAPAAPKRRGRPKKVVSTPAAPKVDGRKNRTVVGGYKLSEWDQFIIDSLKDKQKVLINQELLDLAQEKVTKEKLDMDMVQIRGKLNRSLHKLANRRDDLIKVDFPGKGYAYGLPGWKSGPNDVKKKYRK